MTAQRWIALTYAVLGGCVACGAATPTPLEQAEIVDYGSAQLVCVQVGATREASDSCRNAVKAYWCGPNGPLHDAGACTYTPPPAVAKIADGGGQ